MACKRLSCIVKVSTNRVASYCFMSETTGLEEKSFIEQTKDWNEIHILDEKTKSKQILINMKKHTSLSYKIHINQLNQS